jgi:membrane protease YdiL (CAAX protease family)
MVDKRKLSIFHIVIYLIIFFAIWSIRELIIRPVWLNQFDGLTWHIFESAMKLTVWTIPAILLIKYFQDDMWVSLNEMFTSKLQYFKSAPILLLVFVPLISAVFLHGEVAVRPNFEPVSLVQGVVFVGITEEIVFRGFLLNVFLKKMKVWKAVVLDALLFALIHYPIWIYFGFDITTILLNSVQILPISALFAFSFIKTKNIFVPIAIHSVWNLLGMLFV